MSLQRTLELVAALDVFGIFFLNVCILLLLLVVSRPFYVSFCLMCNLESLISLDSVPYVCYFCIWVKTLLYRPKAVFVFVEIFSVVE